MNKSKVSSFNLKKKENFLKSSKIPKGDSKFSIKLDSSLKSISIKNEQTLVNSKLTKEIKSSNDSISKIKKVPDVFKNSSLSLNQNLISNDANQFKCVKPKSEVNFKVPISSSKTKLTKLLKTSDSIKSEKITYKETNIKKIQEQIARVSPIKRVSIKSETKLEETKNHSVVKLTNAKINLDLVKKNQIKKRQKFNSFNYNQIYSNSALFSNSKRSSINYLEDKYFYSDSECVEKIGINKRLNLCQNKNQEKALDNFDSTSQTSLLLDQQIQKSSKASSHFPCSNTKLPSLIDNNISQARACEKFFDLKQELIKTKTHINNFNLKLSSNLHTVASFENSLNFLKLKVDQVAIESEQKDREIECLTQALQELKKEELINKKIFTENQSISEEKHPNWFKDQVNRVLKINRIKYPKDKDSQLKFNFRSANITQSAPSTPKLTTKKLGPFVLEMDEIRKQMINKEKLLTDIRLDLLSAANQIEDLKENTNQLTKELSVIKEENQKLQCWLDKGSVYSSTSSLNNLTFDSVAGYSKRIFLSINQSPISYFTILTTTTWLQLDSILINKFIQYLDIIDSKFRLGLNENDLNYYETGKEKICRKFFSPFASEHVPEMLPFGYLVQDNFIEVELSSQIAYLVLESNLSKVILNQLIQSVEKNRRVALIGEASVGKSYVASKVAYFMNKHLLIKDNENISNQKVDIIDASSKSEEELKVYFNNLTQLELNLPKIVVFKDIQNISNINIFSSLIGIPSTELPIVIATVTESPNNRISEYLEIHLGFAIINFTNFIIDSEVIVNRFLKKKLILEEMRSLLNETVLDLKHSNRIVDWISQFWKKLNIILRKSNLSTIPLECFFDCPIDSHQSQLWFVNIWKTLIEPFLNDVHFNQCKLKNEFIEWVHYTYPWAYDNKSLISMLGLEQIKNDSDSLLQTLVKLKVLSQSNQTSDNDYHQHS